MIILVSQRCFLFFSVVENECANSVDAVALAVDPVATTVDAVWGFVLFFVSGLTWEMDD